MNGKVIGTYTLNATTGQVTFTPTPRVKSPIASMAIANMTRGKWGNSVVVRGKGTWVLKGRKAVFRPLPTFVGRTTIRYRVVTVDGRVAYSTFTAQAVDVPKSINAGRA